MKKSLLKKIILLPIAVAVIIATIIGNYICYVNADDITSFLVPEIVTYNTENVQEALNGSEEVIQQISSEGITMLKNNGTLPLKSDIVNINMFGVGGTDNPTNGFYLFGGGSGSVTLEKEKSDFSERGTGKCGLQN